jgi:selenocysteine-specific elongation factor
MLGSELGLTVRTKTDAVSEQRAEEVRDGVRQFLSNTFLDTSRMPLVAVSARTGAGMESLRRELASLATRIPERSSDALPRLPLDRAFVMKGFGTVVTGTLIAGTLRIGQMIGIEPDARAARIRGIQVHGRAEEAAYAGSRVALNLAGVDASELRRGDTLVEPSSLTAADAIDVEANLLSHASALKHRSRVHFHAFAAECMATVSLYGYQPVEPGSTRLMRLRLSKPIVLLLEIDLSFGKAHRR